MTCARSRSAHRTFWLPFAATVLLSIVTYVCTESDTSIAVQTSTESAYGDVSVHHVTIDTSGEAQWSEQSHVAEETAEFSSTDLRPHGHEDKIEYEVVGSSEMSDGFLPNDLVHVSSSGLESDWAAID